MTAVDSNAPEGYDLVINATPLGLNEGDALPVDVARMDRHAAVFDILLRGQPTPLVQAARARGLNAQAGFEMLIQQMPHYLRYFGYEQVARALSKDADFLRESIYPPAMHAEIRPAPALPRALTRGAPICSVPPTHSMISGKTTLIAHLGYPTEAFKAPMIYNPWFDKQGIDAVVVPMGVKPEDYATVLRSLFQLTNIRGALVTMPHKIATVALMDEVTPTARIAGACNAILLRPDGTLLGDQFDGAGFVRGVERKGRLFKGTRVLVSGTGGVGSAIAASIAAAGAAEMALFDASDASAQALAGAAARALPVADRAHRLERPGRLRRGRQRHAAGHEGGRPAALRRRPHRPRHLRRRGRR